MENLIEVRCPFQKKSKTDDELFDCNRICVKVQPGSSGEARCRSCHRSFEFTVDYQAKPETWVRVKKLGEDANIDKI